ncbi:TerB N-terminal domain-containing protein [Clostridium pasteurianum]|uniref:TerB N-terminal domain-containing protein n=1 Tax=Clostridium pasteurianum TaxID=1501 RepID=UPI002260B60D|nr:TerB N-terminal domain-containing protein [Clostridium pasteurianum]UZW13447.1 TerB N-terminal domain-containing protein [Clostridium pasteurianum]
MIAKRSKTVCYILALFLGIFGAHLFYAKKYKRAILYLIFCWTYIPLFLGWIDMFFIHKWFEDNETKKNDFYKNKKYTKNNKLIEAADINTLDKEIIDNVSREREYSIIQDDADNNFTINNINFQEVDKTTEKDFYEGIKRFINIINYIKEQKTNNDNGILKDIRNINIKTKEMPNINTPQKSVSLNKKFNFLKNISLISENIFYKIDDIIIPKYSNLKTPEYILKSLEKIKNPNRESHYRITVQINFSTSGIEFVKDSLKYKNKRGIKCGFKPLFEYWTTFESLDNEQKRWYFFWRERVLNGEYPNTDLSYIILFTYELLNYSFNEDAAFNVSMLSRLYDNYKETQPKLKNYLPRWISDFLIELGEEELSKEWYVSDKKYDYLYKNMQHSKNRLEKISYQIWKPYIQNYRETKFFQSYKYKIYNTFKASIALLKDLYYKESIDLFEEWFQEEEIIEKRYLFSSAIIGRDVMEFETKVLHHTVTKKMYDQITALFRISENVTREINGENRKIKVEDNILPNDFEKLLMNKIQTHNTKGSNIKDRFKLVKEADTVSKNISIPKPEKEKKSIPDFVFDIDKINKLNKESENLQNIFREKGYEEESNDEFITESTREEVKIKDNNIQSKVDTHSNFEKLLSIEENEDEEEFINSLNDSEIRFLASFENLKKNVTEANNYFREQGMMAGTFINNINEKANNYLEDTIIELNNDNYEIYEDFEDIVKLIKERMN